MFSAAAS